MDMKTIDLEYQTTHRTVSEYSHFYGKNIHILADPVLLHLSALLSRETTKPESIPGLIRRIYRILLYKTLTLVAPTHTAEVRSRMVAVTEKGVFDFKMLDKSQSYVVVSLARAGIVPAQLCYEEIQYLLGSSGVWQDHFLCERLVGKDNHVTGAVISGNKLGGPIENTILLIPDPMGATGNTLCAVLDHYAKIFPGKPKAVVALHVIVAPEYLKRISQDHPEVTVVSARLDRGLSTPDILKTPFGKNWSKESGLNINDYIVPGVGGVGELLNNTEK